MNHLYKQFEISRLVYQNPEKGPENKTNYKPERVPSVGVSVEKGNQAINSVEPVTREDLNKGLKSLVENVQAWHSLASNERFLGFINKNLKQSPQLSQLLNRLQTSGELGYRVDLRKNAEEKEPGLFELGLGFSY